ncbi:hypothetical protein JTE90_008405 [Oedothorax gibbosus]|uniref:Uncharacterized protein n=1 Tax=Oedothorax gibbosus TaxID=931172 RepID=A0AAV6V4V2_9ARAC|nr:hypothetical protein JTE90_008405 [Oedothorax gibbosus]
MSCIMYEENARQIRLLAMHTAPLPVYENGDTSSKQVDYSSHTNGLSALPVNRFPQVRHTLQDQSQRGC